MAVVLVVVVAEAAGMGTDNTQRVRDIEVDMDKQGMY